MTKVKKTSHLSFIRKTTGRKALYKCDCGNIKEIHTFNVNNFTTISCGCFLKSDRITRATKHGFSRNPLYKVLNGIIDRCENLNNVAFKNYGARGIKICEEWRDYKNFIEWAEANGYKKGLEIDRIDNNGNYEPSNCRWVTPKQNSNNRRSNILIEYNGQTKSLTQWCDELNLKYATIKKRIKELNWSVEKSLTKI